MLLDYLKDFVWENEPEYISFNEEGMVVTAHNDTDFWLDKAHNINKTSAHFFYAKKISDFVCKACFIPNDFSAFSQCGLMIKPDNHNAFKVSLMSPNLNKTKIGTSLSISNFSDWAVYPIEEKIEKIYYKITKKDNVFFIFYSVDDINYHQIRQFSFTNPLVEVKIGAYFASPSENSYKTILKNIEIK